jgi:hypothetical protein
MNHVMDLSGEWEVSIDFANPIHGMYEISENVQWSSIMVPGCWEQVESDKKSDGPVWYRKSFTLPNEWNGKRMAIEFEGVNYYCEVWLNGKSIGSHEGGWNGFQLDLGDVVSFSGTNELLVKLYKQGEKFPIRECLAGFFPDVGVIFGGIWKPVTLKAIPDVTIDDIFVKPSINESAIEIEFDLQTHLVNSQTITIDSLLYTPKGELENTSREEYNASNNRTNHAARVPLKTAIQYWSPQDPQLYTLETKVFHQGTLIDSKKTRFGIKDIHIQGDRIYLNGQPIYLRGVLHWGWYSETIAPIPTREEIRAELQKVKESGFNLVKHCLYVPTKDYFEIADEMGMLIWQELPLWLPQVSQQLYQRVFYQYERIIKEIRNHPSILLWTLGCELDHSINAKFLSELYGMAKLLTNDAIIRDNSGSGECYGGLLKEYADFYDYHFYNDIHFYRDLINQFAGSWRENKPWVFGEFCDYDVYRDMDKVKQHYGGQLPWWLLDDVTLNPASKDDRWNWCRQEEKINAIQLPFSNSYLVENANRSAYVYRKAVLELVRTYQKITGYVLTSIKGNPIATSSIFDDLGQPNHPPAVLTRFNQDTVITLTWDNRRSWVNGGDRLINWDTHNYSSQDTFRPHFFLSHYHSDIISNATLPWKLHDDHHSFVASGEINGITLDVGEAKEVGLAEVILPSVDSPTKLLFTAVLQDGKKEVSNEWPFWVFPTQMLDTYLTQIEMNDPFQLLSGLEKVYPELVNRRVVEEIRPTTKVIVTSMLQPFHYEFMEKGGRVLYIQRNEGEFPIRKLPFWRESLQLFYDHPIMNTFPHEHHTGMLFYGLATDTVFDSAKLPEHTPIMGRLDARTFELSQYMFEKNIGKGRLIATALRLEGGLGAQPSGILNNPAGMYLFVTIVQHLFEK